MLNYPVRMIRYDRFVELQMSRSITMGVGFVDDRTVQFVYLQFGTG